MIEVSGLVKRFGNVLAIDGVTFKVQKGEILGFLGPNAAGKTTTMRILTCFMPASAGTATVAGYDVFKDSLEVRKRVGYMPENVPLYPEMKVKDYLDFMAELRGLSGEAKTKSINSSIEKTAIGDVQNRIVGHLSKGFKQRVGLAQTLLGDPEVLVLDEPTVGLDPRQIIEVRELIKSLAGSHTVILSTHILPEAAHVCSRITIINNGKIVAEDTPENLTARLRGSEEVMVTVRGASANELQTLLEKIPNVEAVLPAKSEVNTLKMSVRASLKADIRSELAKAIVHKNWDLLELTTVGMSLEDIFLKLITDEKGGL
jgi:ABC-2 type transport system ATP-binding protein